MWKFFLEVIAHRENLQKQPYAGKEIVSVDEHTCHLFEQTSFLLRDEKYLQV